jgi:hypothetical protein
MTTRSEALPQYLGPSSEPPETQSLVGPIPNQTPLALSHRLDPPIDVGGTLCQQCLSMRLQSVCWVRSVR